MNAIGPGFNRFERGFIAEPANRAPAGAFGRRVYGRPAPAPVEELEVETILARCRQHRLSREVSREARDIRRGQARSGNGDLFAWLAMALSLLGLWTVSAMSAF